MKIPAVTAQVASQRLKKSIWQPNASKDLPQKKSSTVLNVHQHKLYTRSAINPQVSQENKLSPKAAGNSLKIRKQKREESENVIVDVLEQLQSYENVPISNNFRQNTKPFSSSHSDKKTQRAPFGDISNIVHHHQHNANSFSQITKQKSLSDGKPNHLQQKNIHRSESFIESKLEGDDENDRDHLSQKLQNQCLQIVNQLTQQNQQQHQTHHQQHLSSTSTNTSSTSTVGMKPARCSTKQSNPQQLDIEAQLSRQSCRASQQDQNNSHNTHNSSLHTQSSEGSNIIQTLKHDYLEGYKVYQKQEKLFTFKIFKEDFLKIPAEFAKVIIHSQDDDVSSDDDVVRGGVKFNYKSILKEVYEEHELPTAPILNVHHLHFV